MNGKYVAWLSNALVCLSAVMLVRNHKHKRNCRLRSQTSEVIQRRLTRKKE